MNMELSQMLRNSHMYSEPLAARIAAASLVPVAQRRTREGDMIRAILTEGRHFLATPVTAAQMDELHRLNALATAHGRYSEDVSAMLATVSALFRVGTKHGAHHQVQIAINQARAQDRTRPMVFVPDRVINSVAVGLRRSVFSSLGYLNLPAIREYCERNPGAVVRVLINTPTGMKQVHARQLLKSIFAHGDYAQHYGLTDYTIEQWERQDVMHEGGCSVQHHRAITIGPFKCYTLKSSNDNCLVACFSFVTKDTRQHKMIVRELGLSAGFKNGDDVDKLCAHYKLYARIWAPDDNVVLMETHGVDTAPTIDIVLMQSHYWYVLSGAPLPGAVSRIIASNVERQEVGVAGPEAPQARRVVLDEGGPAGPNDFSAIVAEVCAGGSWLIDSPAGCGKTFLSKLIVNALKAASVRVAVTASTGIAAMRLSEPGYEPPTTIHKHLIIHRDDKTTTVPPRFPQVLLIDEVSMVSGAMMDDICLYATRLGIRLILVGDVMQLPAVEQEHRGWFFQSDFFQDIKMSTVRLSKVRRTTNVEYAEICCRVRTGEPNYADLKFFRDRYVPNASPGPNEVFIAATNKTVDGYNTARLQGLKSHITPFNVEIIGQYVGSDSAEVFGGVGPCPTPPTTVIDPDAPSTSSAPAPILPRKIAATRIAIVRRIKELEKEYNVTLRKGARVMCIKNHLTSCGIQLANGMLGTVLSLAKGSVVVRFDDLATTYASPESGTYVTRYQPGRYCEAMSVDKKKVAIRHSYMPLALAFAMTVHKAQGATFSGPVLFDCTGVFGTGMFYTAVTRVTDPANLRITSHTDTLNIPAKWYEPSLNALKFIRGEPVPTMTEMVARNDDSIDSDYMMPGIEGAPLPCKQKINIEPSEVLYYDFETAEMDATADASGGGNTHTHRIKPYLVTWARAVCASTPGDPTAITRPIARGVYSDFPGAPHSAVDPATGEPIPVHHRIVEELMGMISRFEERIDNEIASLGPRSKKAKDYRKYASRTAPIFSAYNGGAFDLYFLANELFNNDYLDPAKYRISFIPKGSNFVMFSVASIDGGYTVLRSHDLCQLQMSSLADGCRTFLPKDDPSNQKIDFKNEILDISARRYREWANLTWDEFVALSADGVSAEVWDYPSDGITDQAERYAVRRTMTYKPTDVIEYAIRDTDVLPKLYAVWDANVREDTKLSVFSFLTAGGKTFYQQMQHAIPVIGSPADHNHGPHRGPTIELYSLNSQQDEFTRGAIYGGRACPRIMYDSSTVPGNHAYLDISGMYGHIQIASDLPYGKQSWIAPSQIPNYIQKVIDYAAAVRAKFGDRGIGAEPRTSPYLPDLALASLTGRDPATGKPLMSCEHIGYFIGDIEFAEAPTTLEPVIGERFAEDANGVQRAIGTRYNIARRWAKMTSLDLLMVLIKGGEYFGCRRMIAWPLAARWAAPWAERCTEMKIAMKKVNPGKCATAKLDQNAASGQMGRADHMDCYKVIGSIEQRDEFLREYEFEYFTTTGKVFILFGKPKAAALNMTTTRPTGAFAFLLAYSRLMVQQIIACANPTEDPCLQPALGDTDSLLVPMIGAQRLTARGWFPGGDPVNPQDAAPGELADELADSFSKSPYASRSGGPSYKGRVFPVVRWFSPAPKVLYVEFVDPVTDKHYYKFRCKGVSTRAMIGAEETDPVTGVTRVPLMSAAVLRDYLPIFREFLECDRSARGITATMPRGLKKIAPRSVKASDRIASSSLMTIETVELMRTILRSLWEGRQLTDDGITVPHGY